MYYSLEVTCTTLVMSLTVLIVYTKHRFLNLPLTVTLTNEISCRVGFLLNWLCIIVL